MRYKGLCLASSYAPLDCVAVLLDRRWRPYRVLVTIASLCSLYAYRTEYRLHIMDTLLPYRLAMYRMLRSRRLSDYENHHQPSPISTM